MAASVRGAVVLDLSARELDGARRRLTQAQARSSIARRGRFELHDDGRATYELPVVRVEIARVLQGVGVAAAVSVGTSLGLDWMIHQALPAGFLVGAVVTALGISRDRMRLHSEARALLRSLPALVRRGE
jgi:hypothetical protein